jgi:cell division protein FtsZ
MSSSIGTQSDRSSVDASPSSGWAASALPARKPSDSFVAPPPVEPKRPIETRPNAPRKPDPIQEADYANAESGGNRPTLFERMTRTGRARKEDAARTETAPKQEATKPQRVAPNLPNLAGEPTLESPSRPNPAPVSASRERVEEDPLEIPAFLRRQAN